MIIVYISAVIEDRKGQILMCAVNNENNREVWVFPGTYASSEYSAICKLQEFCNLELNIEIECERFFLRDIKSDSFIRMGCNAKIVKGTIIKKNYKKTKWFSVCEIKELEIWDYDRVVAEKVATCEYCKYRFYNKEEIEEFDENMQNKMEVVTDLSKILDETSDDTMIKIVFERYLSHVRAMYIENSGKSLKNNITIQNYLKVNKYEDLAQYIEDIFEIEINEGITLKKVIRECVDKYIAHYDKPSEETNYYYELCSKLIGKQGKIPLRDFMASLQYCTRMCLTVVWYESGEFVPTMDYVDPLEVEKLKKLIRDEVNIIKNKLIISE